MAGKLKLTRVQLASFLQDHEQIRQFERLFGLVDENLNGGDVQLLADTALAVANVALALAQTPDPDLQPKCDTADILARLEPLERLPYAQQFVPSDFDIYPRQELVVALPRVRTITASATVAPDDYCLLVDATAGAVTVTLPPVARGRTVAVKKIDASGNAVTIDGDGSEVIDGAASLAITTQYGAYTIISDGAAWWIT